MQNKLSDPNLFKVLIEKQYAITDLITRYLREEIVPLFPKNITKDKKSALVLTYNRLFLNLNTLRFLKDIFHFQTAASIARTVFELYIDLIDLTETERNYEKFFDWPKVELHRLAQKTVEFNNKYPDRKINPAEDYQKMFDFSQKTINDLFLSQWDGNKKVKHWTGKNFSDRIDSKDIEVQRLYVQIYKLFSWHVHAGNPTAASTTGGHEKEMTFISHNITQKVALESTLIMNKTFQFEKINTDFLKQIENINKTQIDSISEIINNY